MFAMSGASCVHAFVGASLVGELRDRLRGRPCETYPQDLLVLVKPTGLFTYPDITVVCGEPRFLDNVFDTLLNPTVIIEVLSPSTEAYDRGRKFAHCREIVSLREYALVSQDRMAVDWYRREGETWTLRDASGTAD
jgi:Uma2 family endonuclease